MEEIEDEERLNLSLAIVSDRNDDRRRKKKRSRSSICPLINALHGSCDESKIFRLLQMREQMIKTHNKSSSFKHDMRSPKGISEDHCKGLHLIHLLLITATAVDENNEISALENLTELYQTVSIAGDSVQRVVAYFADGLAARLLTRKSPFYDMIMKQLTSEEEFLAFIDLYRVSPYYQFAHFTANQAIIEAFEKEEHTNNRALHVIDFDVSYGFQWPSLIQSLSEKSTGKNRISLRVTGFGRRVQELQETESRLMSFAKGFHNLVFEFHGLLRGSNITNIRKWKNETVAVNLIFRFNTWDNSLKISDTLKSIHSIKPSLVLLVEQGGCRSQKSFLSTFMESLHYFAAMFDSLDDCLPLESRERLRIEKNHLGKEIKSLLNYDKEEDDASSCLRYEKMDTWKERMESNGFEGIKFSSKSFIQAKLLLKIRTHYCPLQFDGESSGGFKVSEREDGKVISLCWQDRCLLTGSAWHCI